MEILVGHTGFVGSNIKEKHHFDLECNSKNIEKAFQTNPDLLIYAGIPAQKFIANQNPEEDMKIIVNAIEQIKKINPKKLVLISTIDVYNNTNNVDELTDDKYENNQAYGKNRRYLEEWVENNINDYHIVRLPGLYGINIKKNFIYDMINYIPSLLKKEKIEELSKINNNIKKYYVNDKNDFLKVKNLSFEEKQKLKEILKKTGFSALNFTDSRGMFQFYNLNHLWEHINKAIDLNIKVLNLATEPIIINELYKYIYGEEFINEIAPVIPNYNFKSIYSNKFGGHDGYILDKKYLLEDIKRFVIDETKLKIHLAISNIAWDKSLDESVYNLLHKLNIRGLEIAPTRIIEEKPYQSENIKKAKFILEEIKLKYKLQVCSMQSIWFGHSENIFESQENYKILRDYTFNAIEYAASIGCKNLVFGNPKNRNIKNYKEELPIAVKFFNEIGDYAYKNNVVIALEPNPTIYNTNFINTTKSAIEFVKKLSTKGIKINYDLGTVIANGEDINLIKENIDLINHIHISEPNLNKIKPRNLHKQLIEIIKDTNYSGFISIEMKKQETIEDIENTLKYIIDIF